MIMMKPRKGRWSLPSEPGNISNVIWAADSASCGHGDKLFKLAFSLFPGISSLNGDRGQKLEVYYYSSDCND